MAQPVLRPVPWSALPRWADDDHAAAFAVFAASAAKLLRDPADVGGLAIPPPLTAARAALEQARPLGRSAARAFFEHHFRPMRIEPPAGRGFVTGYFEPEVAASLARSPAFPAPLYRRPVGLVDLRDGVAGGTTLDPALSFALQGADGGDLTECPDRAVVRRGALDGLGLELAFVANRVEAFFIQVQGSARLRLAEGGTLRVGYDGKSGHPYTPVGRVLIAEGAIPASEMTADRLKAWLRSHPDEADRILEANRSFVFFRPIDTVADNEGPLGAAGVPLTAGRSLAVDRGLMGFHHPIFLEAELPGVGGAPYRFDRLMVAEDTGSAIVGPARGDIFFGSGEAAWRAAAPVRHPADFTVLIDKAEGSDVIPGGAP